MAERVLTTRILNRTLLGRQLLARRVKLSLPAALERVGGLQTQYAPTAYIGAWSRLREFRRSTLTRALEDRRVVQGTLMRGTIHTVSASDFPIMADGVRRFRRDWWMRTATRRRDDVDFAAMAATADRILASDPVRRSDLVAALEAAGFPPGVFEGLGVWLDLVRVPPSGTWERRRADLFQTSRRWLGVEEGDERTGLDLLVRRYLRGFGPAALPDIASWAGVPVSSLEDIVDPLPNYRNEEGGRLVDLPRLSLASGEMPLPVRFLGPWEALLLVHARRTATLPEEHRPLVFHTKNPHSVGTFLVDGRVAGAWRLHGPTVVIERFEPIPRRFIADLRDEADALAAYMRD